MRKTALSIPPAPAAPAPWRVLFGSLGCRIWLNSPKGSAFLYARKEVQHLLEPLVVSWGWQPEKTTLLSLDGNDHPPSPFILQQEWQGARDTRDAAVPGAGIAAYLSVPTTIRFQAEHDWPQVRQECHALLRDCRRSIGGLTGLEQICPDSPDWYAQMATIPLPPCDPDELRRRLYDDYRVEVPIISWGGRQFVRVSVQGYNKREDVEALIAALRSILPLSS